MKVNDHYVPRGHAPPRVTVSEVSDPDSMAPDGTVPVPTITPEHSRVMVSPEAHALDYAVDGDIDPDTGYPVRVSAASGATVERSLSDHLASMGAHSVRLTRSRKGRRSFVVVRHGRVRAPVSDETSGLAGADAITLARLADDILRAHEGERTCGPSGKVMFGIDDIAGAGRTRYLLGTTVRAFAQVTPSTTLTGSSHSIAKAHRESLTHGCGIVGDACGVARHTADVAGWLNGVRREYLTGERRDHRGSRLGWSLTVRLHGRLRASERDEWERVGETSQYVATDDATQCLAWCDETSYWRGHHRIARGEKAIKGKRGKAPRKPLAAVERGA